MKRYFIYETTNLINNKKYRGKRVTKCTNLEPSYLGSGKLLKLAVEKYGKQNFKREIIDFADSIEDLNKLEEKYVNQEWVKSPNTYNMKLGGNGGFDHIRDNKQFNTNRILALREACQNRLNSLENRQCESCGVLFEVRKNARQKYCSTKCANMVNGLKRQDPDNPGKIEVNCTFCNTLILKDRYVIKTYTRYFCNKVCSGKQRAVDRKLNSR